VAAGAGGVSSYCEPTRLQTDEGAPVVYNLRPGEWVAPSHDRVVKELQQNIDELCSDLELETPWTLLITGMIKVLGC
jgi:hypothetical protein